MNKKIIQKNQENQEKIKNNNNFYIEYFNII